VTGEGLAPHHRLATAGLARPGRRAGLDAGAGVSRVGEAGRGARERESEREGWERAARLASTSPACLWTSPGRADAEVADRSARLIRWLDHSRWRAEVRWPAGFFQT